MLVRLQQVKQVSDMHFIFILRLQIYDFFHKEHNLYIRVDRLIWWYIRKNKDSDKMNFMLDNVTELNISEELLIWFNLTFILFIKLYAQSTCNFHVNECFICVKEDSWGWSLSYNNLSYFTK